MTDPKSVKAEEKEVETETTQVESPPTEEPTTEVKTTDEESSDQGSATEDAGDDPVSPEMGAEQRRAFQEQRQEIKRLKEQVAEKSDGKSAFGAFRQKQPPVNSPTPVNVENFTDQATGETNWGAYNQAVNGEIQKAAQSASYAAQQTAEDLIDENNARTKYPELFSDKETEQEIADRWIAAKIRGEKPSILQIAERTAKRFGKAVSKAEKIGADKALSEVSEKEQAGLSASGQTSKVSKKELSEEERQDLSRKTRHGDKDAVATRISKIPWANK